MTGRPEIVEAATAVTVTINGNAMPDQLQVLVTRVHRRFGEPAQCELLLFDDTGYAGWPMPTALGARLRVEVVGEEAPLFTGDITGVELRRDADGTTTARVRGCDALHRLRRRQTLRVLEQVSATRVAQTLTATDGITVDGPDGPRLARVVQHNQSDFELLVSVAARAGRLVTLDGDTLRLSTLDGHGDTIPIEFGWTLVQASVEVDGDQPAQRVTAIGWDAANAAPVSGSTAAARSGRRVPLDVPGGGEFALTDHPASGLDDVEAAAQFAFDLRAARSLVLRGVALGDARLCPGARVDVTGLGDTIDGRYVLAEVVHRIDANGYLTTISTEPPASAATDRGTSVTLGRVTAVDDPTGCGRVRVSLPGLGDPDVGWLGVVCPGAGRGKGLVALPDVGDTVAVALPHADPTNGLVLGSLYGSVTPPDPGVSGAAVRRWTLHTADGQSVVLDDDKHSMRLSNRDGSYLELAPDTVRLHAATDLVLDAPGHNLTVRARAVDFEQATL